MILNDFVFIRSSDLQVEDHMYAHKTRQEIHIQVAGFYPARSFCGVIETVKGFLFLQPKDSPLEAIASILEHLGEVVA